jgi:RNA polymerase sigma factor (sigma-70 family)
MNICCLVPHGRKYLTGFAKKFSFLRKIRCKRLAFFTLSVLMIGIAQNSTAALIEKIRSGGRAESQALQYLIRKDFGKIKDLILKRSGSEADAEDVFQEGLTALLLNIRKEQFKGDSSIHTYLYAICKGIWYKRFQKEIREREKRDQLQVTEVDVATPEISMLNTEQKGWFQKIFELLREGCKDVLMMWASSFSMQEIAAQLNFSNAQVAMNKKSKCLKQLHQLLADRPDLQQLLRGLRESS